MIGCRRTASSGAIRSPAVAGSFYPADPGRLGALVERLLGEAGRRATGAGNEPAGQPLGLLVPHAGLTYSGLVAAAAWRRIAAGRGARPLTVLMLGTNHVAPWLDGVGVWDGGPWRVPGFEVEIDEDLAAAILSLGPPFMADRLAHGGEHSIEVQLPLLAAIAPMARIVALAVSAGTAGRAIQAGACLGEMLGARRTDHPIVVAISSDMAHYPDEATCSATTAALEPAIVSLDPERLARAERVVVRDHEASALVCGMCGIEPTVLGLAALRAAGAGPGRILAAATSADAGGPVDRTVGYLAVEFPAGEETAAGR